jgi:catechol 2,3-dioxygenase-like lactoylglutathione lyase family enzyme
MQRLGAYARGLGLFVAGIVVGTVVMQPSAAQNKEGTGLRLNHVGIAVKPENFEKSVDFYTKVMGFRVAFRMPGPEGAPHTTYFQINRDTFLEMAPASARLPEGITHIGIETADLKTTIMRLRQAGATLDDARVSRPTKALLSNIMDPNGIRLELIELTPESLHKKAEEAWK